MYNGVDSAWHFMGKRGPYTDEEKIEILSRQVAAAEARLIAAAPDLLAAAQDIERWFDHGNHQMEQHQRDAAIVALRVAITAATGGEA